MKKRHIFSIFLSLALLAGLCAAPASAAYSDVSGHAAQSAITRWSERGILQGNGNGQFLPDAPLTRGSFSAIVDRLLGYRVTAENRFADLGENDWYTPYILRLNASGVLQGAQGKAMPEAEITRQEAVTLLGRALALTESTKPLAFADKTDVADWADGYLAAMVELGCFAGEKAFRPTDTMTRAETVTLLDALVPAYVNTDVDYSADVKGTVVVNAQTATLKNMKITGDLIIADGVGDGDVYLDNVIVTGRVILRGCGVNSFHLLPGTAVTGTIIVTKSSDGGIRLVNESGKVLPMVNVADGNDGVTLTGAFKNVVIATDAPVALVNATVKETVSITAPGSNVTLSGTSSVKQLDVAKTAEKAAVTMTDNAKVTNVTVAGNDLTLDNTSKNKPTITVDSSVTGKPTTPGGSELTPTPPSGGGGGTVPTPPTVTTLTAVTALLPSPQADKTAADATPAEAGYTVKTEWSPILSDNKFAKGTVYIATLTFSLASDTYQWGSTAPTVAVRNSTEYAGNASVSVPTLNAQTKTVTVTATYPATASEIKIVVGTQPKDASLTVGSISNHALSVTASVTVNDTFPPNYLISYQWYQFSSADMGDKAPVQGATASSYALPGDLAAGIYYYACGMTADGVDEEVMTDVAAVTVAPAPVVPIALSDARLDASFGLQLTWNTSRPEHKKYNIKFFTGDNRDVEVNGISSEWNVDHTLPLGYAFKNLSNCTITKITLTPYNDDNQSIGNTLIVDCSITIKVSTLTGVTANYDTSTKTFKFTGVSGPASTSYAFELRPLGSDSLTQTIAAPESNVCTEKFDTEYEAAAAAAAGAEGTKAVLFALGSTSSGDAYRVTIHRTDPLSIILTPST